ncbi:uncharacterized protein LOC121376926 isoform X1 [Gigantopelta aegis]|nr:uncharacterized protein LOC121376926 isoform X1 [Gigantopelta aegis]
MEKEFEYIEYGEEIVTSDKHPRLDIDATCIPADDIITTDCSTQTCTEKQKFDITDFITDDKAIHFYTGLECYVKFIFVLKSLGPAAFCLKYIYHNVLNISVPNQFFMMLMKLRRHQTYFEMSLMFGISEAGVKNIVFTWISFVSKQWREINIWPPQNLVKHFSPSDFKSKFPTTRLVIDGTECPVKKPKPPRAQQSTFSTYKNRNTVKTLIGASPGGLISYISPTYGGSTSDRQIVERSNLLSCVDPGDSIMADKGFNVQDLFAPINVAINIPTFFRKKNRMSGNIVMKDRKISSKRVHIERIIGLGKTYKILCNPLTSTETKLSSDIVFICYMLCNFRTCIVSCNA